MIKRRSVLAGMAASSAALGLAACGGNDSSSSSSSSGSSSSNTEGGVVNLTYQHRLPDVEGMVLVSEIVDRWNKENPDIQVNSVKFDGNGVDMITDIETKSAAGNAPDMAQVGYSEVPDLYRKGILADVTAEANNYKSNFSAGTFSLMTAGEVVVGLPQDSGPFVYYYNEAEFERLGISVPTTSDELLEAAKKAAADGKYILSFQPNEASHQFAGWTAAAGDSWFKPEAEGWRVTVESEASAKVAEFWQSALDDKTALVAHRWEAPFAQALLDGTLIGTFGAAWEAALIAADLADAESAGKWKVAQLPAFGGNAQTGPFGGSGVAVVAGSKHPAEALKFIDWFNRQVDDLSTQGLVTAANETVQTPAALAEFFGGQDVMAELAKANSSMNPDFLFMPTWSALAAPLDEAASAAGEGTAPVANILTRGQEVSVTSLKDAGLPVVE